MRRLTRRRTTRYYDPADEPIDHLELIAVPALMLADYLLTILGAKSPRDHL